jgi:hypothetical protein
MSYTTSTFHAAVAARGELPGTSTARDMTHRKAVLLQNKQPQHQTDKQAEEPWGWGSTTRNRTGSSLSHSG